MAMTDPSHDRHPRPCLLIYDGQCRLCVTAKKGIEQLQSETAGSSLRMITYQSDEAKQALGTRYRPGRPDVAFLVDPDGRVAQGLDAFLPLLPGLKGGRFLAGLLAFPLGKPLGNLLYWFVARYRYHLFGAVPLERYPGPEKPQKADSTQKEIPPSSRPTNFT
jgi:predicted DCC family thiol-disulfide oxidoreductase YuxK